MRIKYYLGRLNVRLRGLKYKKSNSQLNEDNVIDWLLDYKDKGTYIDIGAFHPSKMSNTKLFYDRGWRGVNIEPSGSYSELFLKERPGDINLTEAIGNGVMTYYFQEGMNSSGNTFTKTLANKRDMIKKREINLTPLSKIFEILGKNHVDFITIDVEGFEDDVLKSNDWNKYGATVLCLEGDGYDYLKQFGYKRVFFDGGNSYYKKI